MLWNLALSAAFSLEYVVGDGCARPIKSVAQLTYASNFVSQWAPSTIPTHNFLLTLPRPELQALSAFGQTFCTALGSCLGLENSAPHSTCPTIHVLTRHRLTYSIFLAPDKSLTPVASTMLASRISAKRPTMWCRVGNLLKPRSSTLNLA